MTTNNCDATNIVSYNFFITLNTVLNFLTLHVRHEHEHEHEMDCVRTTNNADTHTNEWENGDSRLVASSTSGTFLYIFFFTILMSVLRINYTYEWRRHERQGDR